MPSNLEERKKKIEKTIGSQSYKKLSEKQKDLMAKTAGVIEIPMPSNLEEQIREILPLEEWKKRYGSKGDCFCSGFDCGKVGCVVWQEMLVQKLFALFSKYLSSLQKEIEGIKKFTTKVDWKCPKCGSWGIEGGYCQEDGRKLKPEEFKYANNDQEHYNQALADVLDHLAQKRKGVKE
jgi:hypothetical protein